MALKFFMLTALVAAAAVVEKDRLVSYVFTETTRFDDKAWTSGRDRFPAGAHLVVVTAGARRPLVPNFYASADAAVSFDATRVLFSAKRTTADHWQVYEIALTAGASPKALTHDAAADCIRPLYLPGDKIVYTKLTRTGSYLQTADARLTYGPARVLTADVLRDGRVLFESAATAAGPRELMLVYPDGTGVEAMRCDHGADRNGARQLSNGDVVFRAGDKLAKFTSLLARQAPLADINASSLVEVSPALWMIAGPGGLQQWDAVSKRVIRDLDLNGVQPSVIAPRTPPLRFPSALVPTRKDGNLLCMDVRVSKPALTDKIQKVRFYTQTVSGAVEKLGDTPVEKDGSFFVQLPADRPLRMELLDAAGTAVKAEHGWFWMKPSEQRICVGCHAGPERAPENKVPAVLQRSTEPTRLMGQSK